jgi:hypothetical protein
MLQLTAALFAFPATHALTTRHLFYAALLFFLTAASVAWHSCSKDLLDSDNRVLFWLDQFALWSVATWSFYAVFHVKGHYRYALIALSAALIAVGIYLSIVWWNKKESPQCHSAIHVLSVLTMHCILLSAH